ncbi:MAG: hypothetical protein JRG91_03595 [Deltaproteobacteria bacterium]|nr:hypothetical protein [Deltaproteobacteria bacterium]
MRKLAEERKAWAPILAAVALALLAGCDQEYPSGYPDATVDITTETPGEDPVVEPADDPVVEPVDEPAPCEYPGGPYAFDMVGQIAGPATWPGCIKGAGETSSLAQADMAAFQCDPDVQTIGVFFSTLS